MESNGDKRGEIAIHQVAEIGIRSADEMLILQMAHLSLSAPFAIAEIQFSLTPLQGLRVARDLVTVVEECLRREQLKSSPSSPPSKTPAASP